MKRVIPTNFPDDPFLDSPATLGAAIRAARTQAGLRQEDAALSIGVALQTLVDIERGKAGVSIGKIASRSSLGRVTAGCAEFATRRRTSTFGRFNQSSAMKHQVKPNGQCIGWLSMDNESGLYQFEYSANWLPGKTISA
jgi:DNA-binding XRE family transcriptional regulator